MNAAENIAFRDLTGLIKWFRVALGAFFILAILSAFSNWQEIDLLRRVQNDDPNVDDAMIDTVTRVGLAVAGFKLITYVATGFFFARWTYLTKKNTLALGASGLAFSPGWSVGIYFVPVLCLWKPYQAQRETFKASHPDFRENWKSAPHPGLLPWWWAIWIIDALLGQALFRLSLKAETIPSLIDAAWMDTLSIPLDLALVAAVWVLVSTLQKWQTAKFNALQAGRAGAGATGPGAQEAR